MELWKAAFLGMVQGLTEFLPISSSGHLVIFQHLFGLTEPELFFDVSVHLGTLLAVVIFYRRQIAGMVSAVASFAAVRLGRPSARVDRDNLHLVWMVLLGSVPTALIGLGIKPAADRLFASMTLVGIDLVFTGCLLFLTGVVARRRARLGSPEGRELPGPIDAILIGVAQGMAILPGISRSGTTIAVGLFLGLRRKAAAAYSFLLSIPAITGAALLLLKDAVHDPGFALLPCLAGAMTAFLVGYASLALLVFIVRKGRLAFFAPYCWLVGLLALLY